MSPVRLWSGAAVVAIALAGCIHLAPAERPGERLDPASQPKFVHALPNPLAHPIAPDTGRHPGIDYYEVRMGQVRQDLGLRDPRTGQPLLTEVWGYGAADGPPRFPGPTFLARQGRPARVRWQSALPGTHLLPAGARRTGSSAARPASTRRSMPACASRACARRRRRSRRTRPRARRRCTCSASIRSPSRGFAVTSARSRATPSCGS